MKLTEGSGSVAIGAAVVIVAVGLGFAPAAFAEPPTSIVRKDPGPAPTCVTFDQMIQAQEDDLHRPGAGYGVLNVHGGYAEMSSTPGPQFLREQAKLIAGWRADEAKKIAAGAACIGYVQ